MMHQQVQHSTTVRSAHTVFMCFVFIWEKTATFATYSINWLVFTTEMKSVYCVVRIGSLNKAVCALSSKAKGGRGQQASRGHRPRWPSRLKESRSALISRAPFGYPDWGFPLISSAVRPMPRYTMQIRGMARTPLPQARRFHLSAWKKSQTCKPAVCDWASLGSEPRQPTKQSISLP